MEMTDLTEEQKKYISISSSASNHLLTLINDILDYSKIDANKIELEIAEIDIRELLDEINSLFESQLGDKDVVCYFSVDQDIPKTLLGDKHRIKQVLFNLMSNAIKFTIKGQVSITVDGND